MCIRDRRSRSGSLKGMPKRPNRRLLWPTPFSASNSATRSKRNCPNVFSSVVFPAIAAVPTAGALIRTWHWALSRIGPFPIGSLDAHTLPTPACLGRTGRWRSKIDWLPSDGKPRISRGWRAQKKHRRASVYQKRYAPALQHRAYPPTRAFRALLGAHVRKLTLPAAYGDPSRTFWQHLCRNRRSLLAHRPA